MKLKLSPVKARALDEGREAWFYENAKSIDVYIHEPGIGTVKARITRKALADYVHRSKPPRRDA